MATTQQVKKKIATNKVSIQSMKKKKKNISSIIVKDQDIANLAYELYLKRGCTPGKDQEDWYNAERILKKKKL